MLALVLGLSVLGAPAMAQDVWITEDLPVFEYEFDGQAYLIERDQDEEATIEGSFAKTSRPCPPFCVHAMEAAPGVTTVGELELIDFLAVEVEAGTGLLIDSRLANWYDAGTIPGAINMPFNLFNPEENPFFEPVVGLLGAQKRGDAWDFSEAKKLALFCNGAWCDQSPRAIRNLISIGYPPEKLFYYRGGMQSWLSMGFNTMLPAGS
ncbi:MAG: rhodanese-like domain-containing protein [Paracoccaceae bacterium]